MTAVKAAGALLWVTYPLLILFGLQVLDPRFFGGLLLALLLLRRRGQAGRLWDGMARLERAGLLALMTLALAVAAGNSETLLRLYPAAVNLGLLVLFGLSLWRPPSLVERLARLQDPQFSDECIGYTRRVTQVWCGFFVLNGGLAAATALAASREVWALYNGFVAYLLMGLLFAGEWLVRRRVFECVDSATVSPFSKGESRGISGIGANRRINPPCPPLEKGGIRRAAWVGEGRGALERLLVAARPDAQPLCVGPQTLNWGQFRERVLSLAAHFQSRPAQRLLITAESPADFAVALMACWRAGRVAVLPPNFRPGTATRLAGAFDAVAEVHASQGTQPLAPAELDRDASRIVLYTSGSSGEPKPVRKTLRQLAGEVAVLESLWGEAMGRAAVVATVPHHHIYGLLFRLLWPLAAGRPFDTVLCSDPSLLRGRLAELGDSVLVSSPALLARLPELLDLAGLQPPPRLIFSSGAPLPEAAATAFHQGLGFAPIEIYGSTETGGIAWRRALSPAPQPSLRSPASGRGEAVWKPLPGVTLQRAEDGAWLLTSPFLEQSPLRLDDAVELLADGRFKLAGRLDRIVKIEDKRIALADVENRLREHAWVLDAAAVTLARSRALLGAVLVLTPLGKARLEAGRLALIADLRRHLADCFDPLLLPRQWRFVEALPYDERGKLPQATLAALFTPSLDRAATPLPPLTRPVLSAVEGGAGGVNGVEAVLLPEILAEQAADGRASLRLRVPPDLLHFAGHFPGLPLLPGVVQVDWVQRLAARHFALPIERFAAVENLKFASPVAPGTELLLDLAWQPERGRLEFSYRAGERLCSKGRLVFDRAAGKGT